MRQLVEEAQLNKQITVDSAGTGSWHAGEEADERARACLNKNGYPKPSRARQITQEDFNNYDYIVAMDHENLRNLMNLTIDGRDKLSLILDWTKEHKGNPVPDPYYGPDSGFDEVLSLCEAGCLGFRDHLSTRLN